MKTFVALLMQDNQEWHKRCMRYAILFPTILFILSITIAGEVFASTSVISSLVLSVLCISVIWSIKKSHDSFRNLANEFLKGRQNCYDDAVLFGEIK